MSNRSHDDEFEYPDFTDEELLAIEKEQAGFQFQIATFRCEKDADGNLKHPHFEAVIGIMSCLLYENESRGLQEAYDMAAWANPKTRSELLSAMIFKNKNN